MNTSRINKGCVIAQTSSANRVIAALRIQRSPRLGLVVLNTIYFAMVSENGVE